MKYKIDIPFELEINKCPHCELRFSIIAPWETEDAKDFRFQTFGFCPYCGESPNQPLKRENHKKCDICGGEHFGFECPNRRE